MTTETTAPNQSTLKPLADENGDTSKISAALDFVTWALTNGGSETGDITFTSGQAFGLCAILDTCSTALKEML